MQKSTSVNVIVHHPKTDRGRRELEAQIAAVHSNAACAYISALPCSAEQKALLAKAAAL